MLTKYPLRLFFITALLGILVFVTFGPSSITDWIPLESLISKDEAQELSPKKVRVISDSKLSQFLNNVRQRQLRRAVDRIAEKNEFLQLCDFSACEGNESSLCQLAPELNPEQIKYCGTFVAKYLTKYQELVNSDNIKVLAIDNNFDSKSVSRTLASTGGNVEFSSSFVKENYGDRMLITTHMAREFWKKIFDPFVGFHLQDGKHVEQFGDDSGKLLWGLALAIGLEANIENLAPLMGPNWVSKEGRFGSLEYGIVYSQKQSVAINAKQGLRRKLSSEVRIKLGNGIGEHGGLIWFLDSGEYYYAKFWYDFGLYKVTIEKVSADGTRSKLAEGKENLLKGEGLLRMSLSPTEIQVFLNDKLFATATDSSLKGSGYVGISGERASFSEFWAEAKH